MSMAAPAVRDPHGISYEEFLATVDEGTHAEWVDGEVVFMSPAGDQHQDVAGFLYALFRVYAEERTLGKVRDAPFQMKTGPGLPGREPDVLFVATENLGRLHRTHLAGPADLVVEVISPESVERDRRVKFQEYQKGGVREYWLIDPARERAAVYRLNADGLYEPAPEGDPPRLRSEVMPGLWIDPAWLWSDPMPTVNSVQREWGLI